MNRLRQLLSGGSDENRKFVLKSLYTRVATLPLALFAVLAVTRLVVKNYGLDGFALYTLIVSIPALLPIADLGVGAAITDSIARSKGGQDVEATSEIDSVLAAGVRVLAIAGGVVGFLAIAIGVVNLWPLLLGASSNQGINWAAAVSVAVFGVTLPGTLGSRLLLGASRNHLSVILQAAVPVLTLAAVGPLSLLKLPLSFVVIIPVVTQAFGGLLAWILGARALNLTARQIRQILRAAIAPEPWAMRVVRRMAGPMAVISCSLPLAYQSDRLVLSHAATIDQVAIYSAAAQVFTPALSIVSAAGLSLWPRFAASRSAGAVEQRRAYLSALTMFGIVGLALSLSIVIIGPIVVAVATDSTISVTPLVFFAFASLLLAQSVHFPGGMFLTDSVGLRWQAAFTVSMLIVNVPLSVFLTTYFGAAGPVLASGASLLSLILLPTTLVVLRRTRDKSIESSHS